MVGIKGVSAQTSPFWEPPEAQPDATASFLAQTDPLVCTYEWQEPQAYARVVTQTDPLRIRATPGGRIIGAVPKDWAVVVLEVNDTGEWTKITSHFGDLGNVGFASASSFRDGWVASRYLNALGEFCEKPPLEISTIQGLLGAEAQHDTLQEDWLQMGDRIAHPQQPS